MKIRLLLKKRGQKGGTHPIYIGLYENDQTELIFTGERIALKDWSKSERAPKDHSTSIYVKIEKKLHEVTKVIQRMEVDDKPISPFTIKQAFLQTQKEKKVSQRKKDKKDKDDIRTVYSLAKNYKEDLPARFSASTKKTVDISVDQFMQYLDKSGLRTLELRDLNNEIIDGYAKYLLDKRRLSDSTHNKRMKHLNWFLKSIKFQATIIPRKLKKKSIIALTVPELHSLEKIDVTTHKDKKSHEYFQRAKDMFLLGCYTALRISDLRRLNPTNTADGYINLTTQKNNELFKMPIVSQAQAILDRYAGKAPKISEQEVNRSIKQICQLAKIDKDIEIEGTRGGKSYMKTVPKYELITSHIAGKTFITNAKELWGLDPAEVAAIVRKDLKTMLNHYFKLPVESATIKMMTADSAAQMKIA